jgi:caa(3)-type oxidase subunit IV
MDGPGDPSYEDIAMSDQVPPIDGMSDAQEQGYYKLYWMVFIALCVCTALSFAFNTILGHGAVSANVLISIVAIIKAALVVMIFMHLKFDWKKVAAIMVPVLIMCVMTVIIFSIDQALAWHAYPESEYPAGEHAASDR